MNKRIMNAKVSAKRVAIALASALAISPAVVHSGVVAEASDRIMIYEATFPDENFREYVAENIDTDGDGYLSTKEIDACTEIVVSKKNIESLEGIEIFTNLTKLDACSNDINIIDVSKNTKLEYFCCGANGIGQLDVSQNTALTTLFCNSCRLDELDVTNNPYLVNLDFGSNSIKNIDLSNNIYLKALGCKSNDLTSLDISNNTELEILECDGNELTSLDVTGHTKLTELSCRNTGLTSLDVSDCTLLTKLICERSKLESLDVSNNPELISLDCGYNNLTNLDISANSKLTELGCDYNNLTKLNLAKNTELTYLGCADNKLTSIDVSKCTKLSGLLVCENNLTKLDVTNNTELTFLNCGSNKLTALDVTRNTKLTDFRCYDNKLKSIDVSKNVNLEDFTCMMNQLTKLDVSKCVNLQCLLCDVNSLTSIDLSKNKKLQSITCNENKITSLDLSNNKELVYLECASNKITSLDLSKNPLTTEVYADSKVNIIYYGSISTPTVTAIANAENGIKITWNKVSDAQGYIIYRKAAGGSWKKIKTVGSGTLKYVDVAVAKKSGKVYSYTVRSYKKNSGGNMVYSTLNKTGKSLRRLAQVTLKTPTSTAKGVAVKWSKVTGASGYIVYRKAGTQKTWSRIAKVQGNAKTSYLDTKAKTNGAKYVYTVKAYYGKSAGSANQTGKALYYVASTSLTSLKNTASESVTVKWKKNAKATGYQVQYSTSAKFTGSKTVTVKGSASVTKTLSKLTKGKTYYVRVRSYKKGTSANYFSAWSSAKKVTISN